MKANDIVIEFNSVSYFCHVRFYRLHNQSFAVKGKVNVVRISWLFAPHQTRPVCYRVRSPPNFFVIRSLYAVCSAMNFIVGVRFQKNPPLPQLRGFKRGTFT